MKRKGHDHKESFSILFISHAGQRNRQINISQTTSRVVLFLLIFLLLILFGGAGLLGWMIYQGAWPGDGQNNLRAQLDSQTQIIQQLEAEKESLNNEMQALAQENEMLRSQAETGTASTDEKDVETQEDESASDAGIPKRYPSSSTSSLLSNYSEEEPYLSISMREEGNIVATGNGTVVTVSSDETYPVIIEVEHEKGYKTRYLCHEEADVKATEGAQVEAGDTLFTITTDETRLDYQILFEGEEIDPLTVIEAKG